MKATKIILWLLGALFGLLALVVIYLLVAFDPNDYRQRIGEMVQEKTGLQLEIKGPMSWSLFPQFAITLEDVQAGYPDRPTVATLQHASVAMDVPALISGRLSLSGLMVDGLVLDLNRDKTGANNWDRPSAASSSPAARSTAEPGSQPASSASRSMALAIDDIDLQNVQVNYHDLQANQNIALGPVNLRASAIRLGQAFPLTLTLPLSVQADGKQAIQLGNKLQASMLLDPERQLYQLHDMDLLSTIDGVTRQSLLLEIKGDVDADLQQQQVRLPNLKLALNGMQGQLDATVKDLQKAPALLGSLQIAELNLRKWLSDIGMSVSLPDEKALTAASMATALMVDRQQLSLTNLTARLDESKISGSFQQPLNKGQTEFKLGIDQLNLDRYVASSASVATKPEASSSTTAAATAKTTSDAGYSKAPMLPVDALQGLNLRGSVQLGKLTYQQVAMSQVKFNVAAAAGKLVIDQASAQIAEGKVALKAQVDAQKVPLRNQLQFNVDHLALEQVQTLLGSTQPAVNGIGSMSGSLSMSGNSVFDWVNSLNGSAKANVTDGRLNNINLTQQICEGIAFANQETLTAAADSEHTRLTNASLQAQFNNGVAHIDSAQGQLVGASAKGSGQINLPQRQLDMGVGVIIEGDTSREACTINPKFQGLEWPLRCQGSLDGDPAKWCRPDKEGFTKTLTSLASNEAKRKAQKELNRALDKQSDKLSEKLGGDNAEAVKGLLQGLFKK
ncbi:hypothetical protein C4K68_09375 [Pokkaliibacter plantistimulans]|uniref:AsmA domain-containing protein n=1 Tax=Proteobacteria bacterium 228 TaxID=2083153 RepID=A0A2S5KS45_9PROT|nr:AsmA family protein [Pokkaliibacter plantistimulans]PPC77677.1 hypothetical protein C4K68_09375 [Pokkaliibacter plantistimulans]